MVPALVAELQARRSYQVAGELSTEGKAACEALGLEVKASKKGRVAS